MQSVKKEIVQISMFQIKGSSLGDGDCHPGVTQSVIIVH